MKFEEYSAVLWDIDKSEDSRIPDDFVVRRVLAYGNIFLIFKVIRMFGKEYVAHVFAQMKHESMNAKRHTYLREFVLVKKSPRGTLGIRC